MLRKALITTSMVALLSTTIFANSNGNGNGHGKRDSQNSKAQQLQSLTSETLTQTQKNDLTYLIEEEKLARDVYATLYDKWNSLVFSNIVKSEIKHMSAVERLLTRYGVEAPSTLDTIGNFENEKLQELYDALVERGEESLTNAFEVAVEVEELDISDVTALLEEEIPSDFKNVYSNLLKGSYRHLKAFNIELSR